jgi:antitoxin (DNA-binding transcriptional repressor) of toxin-antitoxin stability system
MKTIDACELKTNLDRVLRELRQGETFLVTELGEVVAELRSPVSLVQQLLDEGRADRLDDRIRASAAAQDFDVVPGVPGGDPMPSTA